MNRQHSCFMHGIDSSRGVALSLLAPRGTTLFLNKSLRPLGDGKALPPTRAQARQSQDAGQAAGHEEDLRVGIGSVQPEQPDDTGSAWPQPRPSYVLGGNVFLFAQEWANLVFKFENESERPSKAEVIKMLHKKYNKPGFNKILPILHTLEF